MIRALGLLAAAATACAPSPTPAESGSTSSSARSLAVVSCTVVDGRADRRCTPGVLNPDVTQATIRATICRSGWTATVRPPVAFTNGVKDQQKVRYGEAGVPDSALEEDHLVPLELGGAPRDPANLWPQPWDGSRGARTKDGDENRLHRAVCTGRLTLADAQQQILAGWSH